jgi:hypothetical protein
MRNQSSGRLDHAIDRALRGMMEIDPPPRLRYRVAHRIDRRRARPAFVAAFAAAAVLIAIAGSWMALGVSRANRQVEPRVAVASQAQPEARPAAPAAAAPSATTPVNEVLAPRPASGRHGRSLPRPTVIFGGARDTVSAASVATAPPTPDAGEAAPGRLPEEAPLPVVAPITIAPITISPIVIPPLRIPPIGGR